MTGLEKVEKILLEEFDAYVILGTMYDPSSGITNVSVTRRGNAYAIESMLREQVDMVDGMEEVDG